MQIASARAAVSTAKTSGWCTAARVSSSSSWRASRSKIPSSPSPPTGSGIAFRAGEAARASDCAVCDQGKAASDLSMPGASFSRLKQTASNSDRRHHVLPCWGNRGAAGHRGVIAKVDFSGRHWRRSRHPLGVAKKNDAIDRSGNIVSPRVSAPIIQIRRAAIRPSVAFLSQWCEIAQIAGLGVEPFALRN